MPELRVAEHVTWYEYGERIVAINLRDRRRSVLNPTASRLWRRLLRGADKAELVALLRKEGSITSRRALADVVGFIRMLRTRGLVYVFKHAPRRRPA